MTWIPWEEKIPTISINPDCATRDDIARLASDLMEAGRKNKQLEKAIIDHWHHPDNWKMFVGLVDLQ